MIAIPAMELRGGIAYRGNGEHAELAQDPLAIADELVRYGFTRLHLLDLDTVAGVGPNDATLRTLLAETPLHVQVAGGVRSTAQVDELFDTGVDWVVLGARATDDRHWLAELTARHPQRLFVRVAVLGRRVATRGWVRVLPPNVVDLTEELNEFAIAGVLLQPAHREGDPGQLDLALLEDVVDAAHYPVCAMGSMTSIADLRVTAERGAAAAVIPVPFDGALNARIIYEEFGE